MSTTSTTSSTATTANANERSAVRDAEETGNRFSESVERGMNTVKRAVVGGNPAADHAGESIHSAQNRVSEVKNRVNDVVATARDAVNNTADSAVGHRDVVL